MTPEKARKLQRLIWMQRLKLWGPLVAIVLAVFGGFVWATAEKAARVDPTVEIHMVGGEVMRASRVPGRGGGFRVHVRLEGGKEVDALSRLPRPPYAGEPVKLRAAAHESGRVTYTVARLPE